MPPKVRRGPYDILCGPLTGKPGLDCIVFDLFCCVEHDNKVLLVLRSDLVAQPVKFLLDNPEHGHPICSRPPVLLLGPRLHELDQRAAGVDDDGLGLPVFLAAHIIQQFIVAGYSGRGAAVLRLDTGHAVVCVEQERRRGRQGQGSLAQARGSTDNHHKFFVAEIQFSRFLHCHKSSSSL
ncbi:MAG: hypothetical protein [Caudoviricetes sp.]|nr:MAG: hypothetical protein [Caudoviricetes sp.]